MYCECNLFTKVLEKEHDSRFRTLYWIKTDEPVESDPQLSDDEMHLCYLGSINNVIDINYIASMCNELSKYKKVVIHIVGDGEKRQELLQKLNETEAVVEYHGLVYDVEKKQCIFDKCHFGLNIMKSSVCVGLTMKSLDYFQAGLPIINNIQGDTSEMVDQYKIGINGYEQLIDQIDTLGEEEYMQMRENVRRLYQEQFTRTAFEKRLKD